ncbi:MAG: hypothetical protein GY847_09040 [Proteobacteria bacterium]|nr:hypothetical protein [Pseudomonadota bacterium]
MALSIEEMGYTSAEVEANGVALKDFFLYPSLNPNGRTLALLDTKIQRNTLVDEFALTVFADRGDWAQLGGVGDVRSKSVDADTVEVVVDFSIPMTVSGVGVTNSESAHGLYIDAVYQWLGNEFSNTRIITDNMVPSIGPPLMTSKVAMFSSEVMTQRLRIEVRVHSPVEGDLAQVLTESVCVKLPSLPAGLEIAINNGPVAWHYPGVVQAGKEGWDTVEENGRTFQVIDLAQSLQTLAGDPENDEELDVQVALRARIPGTLELDQNNTSFRYIQATDLGPEKKLELTFDEEGYTDVPVVLPSGTSDPSELLVDVSGTLTEERVVPPVGPEKKENVVLVQNPDHAACVRIPSGTGLISVSGIRLPLAAVESAGGEATLALLENIPPASEGAGTPDSPGAQIDGAVSAPVSLKYTSDGKESWVTFAFEKPVALDESNLPWTALMVTRGTVHWSLCPQSASLETEIRRGPPSGPWQPLPAIFCDGGAQPVSGRLRMMGYGEKNNPVMPVLVELCGGDTDWDGSSQRSEITPKKADGTVSWVPEPTWTKGSGDLVLRLTSRTPGTITLRNVRIIAKKS